MVGYVVVKVRCKNCMKSMVSLNKCKCEKPQPERIEMRRMTPVSRDFVPAREAVACAS